MWPLFEPIRTLEILKLCEISWDLLKKYFHLKSNAVYNSSAKKYGLQLNLVTPNMMKIGMYMDLSILYLHTKFKFLHLFCEKGTVEEMYIWI